MLRLTMVAALLLAAAGCKKEDATSPAAKPVVGAMAAALENGVQKVKIVVTDTGYTPKAVELKAGVPAQLIFEQQSKLECGAEIQVEAFGVKPTALPFGKETTISIDPKEAGTYTFACGMNMMKGKIVVKG